MKVVSFKAEEELLEALDALAKQKRTSRSELIRKAIRLYLAQQTRPYTTRRIRVY